jgi:hypothetical protein
MEMKIISGFLTLFILTISLGNLKADSATGQGIKEIPVEIIIDKIRGGLLGQILGNLNGLKHEFRYILDPGNVTNYVPALPEGAWTDDDTDFEWVYIVEMQKTRNTFLSYDYITELWQERINDRIWCSNRFSRHLMDIGIKPPYTGYEVLNPWAEFNVSGQFLCETFGLVAPGMPQTAARIGLNYTLVAISNEPAQTTQLFTTMIATAFLEDDINNILDAGIASLDNNSIILQIIDDVKRWHIQNPDNWRETRRLIRDKYTQEDGGMRDRNGIELNTAAIIAALLYGKGDFQESLKLAFNLGWDADCNAATVGTIIGVIYGYRKMMNHNDGYNPEWLIVDRYKNTTRDGMPMDETITSFSDRIVEIFEMVNENNGGSRTVADNKPVYIIPIEQPAPVIKLTSFVEQKQLLQKDWEQQIIQDLSSDNRRDRARAAYLAVCLGMDSYLARSHQKLWRQASQDLSGYWKIMNNIFFDGSFQNIIEVRERFGNAGFKAPLVKANTSELFHDKEYWRNPEDLY